MKRIGLHFPLILGVMAVVMFAAVASAQDTTGSLFKLILKASKLKAVTISQGLAGQFTFSGQCPGVGTASFSTSQGQYFEPVNDTTQYFDGVHQAPVLEISHLRVTNYESDEQLPSDLSNIANFNGITRLIVQRQDWTRIKENDNGIDNQTGVRHYIGNFAEESQKDSSGNLVVTAESQGEITVLEPLNISTGPLAGVATRVNAVQFIGRQAAWFEPFQVADVRQCNYLNPTNTTPTTFPVNPLYNDHCAVNGKQSITYNGVTFNGNIVGCTQTTWP